MPTSRLIEPIYTPDDDGEVLLYAGPMVLQIEDRDAPIELAGDLVLELKVATKLVARFQGPFTHEAMELSMGGSVDVSIGSGADLNPPVATVLPQRTQGGGWFSHTQSCSVIDVGKEADAIRFIIHITGALRSNLRPLAVAPDVHQGQVQFTLPGWQLTLAEVRPSDDDSPGFNHVIEAVPNAADTRLPVGELLSSLFYLLSFMAGREVGIGAACGLDADGSVVWAHWSSSRQRPGRPGVSWCAPMHLGVALPVIAQGVAHVEADPYLKHVYRRAAGYLHTADGGEVLDVRVPMACAGVELLAWGVLQHEGWARSETLGIRGISAAAAARLLLRSAGIPTQIPDHLDLLRQRVPPSQKDWGGPEVIFGIRNALIHPPKGALSDFAVPTPEEMFQAWQLAGWYLKLALLHLLGHGGKYWNRLQLGRSVHQDEPVPWAPAEVP